MIKINIEANNSVTIAAHGNPHIATPNLDRLAAGGFSFRGNYIFGANNGAVCVPSRAMLMSGKTWFHVDTATLKDAKLVSSHVKLLLDKGANAKAVRPDGSGRTGDDWRRRRGGQRPGQPQREDGVTAQGALGRIAGVHLVPSRWPDGFP